MVSKQPAKKAKAASKKVAKRGVGKKPAPRKAVKIKQPTRAELNQLRLEEDKKYYNAQEKERINIRTKGSKKHPRGVPLEELDTIFDSRTRKAVGYEVHGDSDIYLSKSEYDSLKKNPRAIPHYIPVYEGVDAKGKPKVKHFIRAGDKSKTPVSAHYRYRIFGHYFKDVDEELYKGSTSYWKHQKKQRSQDLIESYRLLHSEMTEEEVNNDPLFQSLVEELLEFSSEQSQFTKEYVKTLDTEIEYLNDVYGKDISEYTPRQLKDLVGSNPRYQEVLVLLGRRLPSEDRPVGSYGPGYIKNVLIPRLGLLREAQANVYGTD